MSNINVVILTGNMTRDPEVNYAGQVADHANFSIAVNQKWTDRQSNQQKEETSFVDCTAWKGTANIVAQYCKKGSKVGIEGKLKQERWTNKQGQNRQKLTVKVIQIELLDGPPQNAPGHHGHYEQPPQPQQQYVDPDEIPF